jgi:hypothetical protein
MFVPVVVVAFVTAVSPASSGPDLAERATAIALPVEDVFVFSDRARVTRRGPVRFGGGVQVLRAPDLPGAVLPGTLRVTATGNQVVRLETRPVERERVGIEQVDRWIVALEAVQQKAALAQGRLAAVRGELALLQGLVPTAPLPEKDRVGKPLVPSPEAWKNAEDRLAARRAAARVSERTLEDELRGLAAERERLQREIAARDLGAFSETRTEVVVIVDGAAGEGTLAVEYMVPGASWWPTYDLLFDPEAGTVQLAAAGLVSQASGEDWPQTHLSLSTAIPGEGLTLPRLRTWTLGDDREFVPVPYPRAAPPAVAMFEAPVPRLRAADVERQAERALLAERISSLVAMVQGDGLGRAGAGAGGGGVATDSSDEDEEQRPPRERERRKRLVAPPPPPPASAPSMSAPAEAPGAFLEKESYADEAFAEETSASAPMAKAASGATRSPTRGLRLHARDAWQRPTFADPFLPAHSAGGFDAVYPAPLRTTVPSQAERLRVPLATRRYQVTTFYEATPSLSPTAYLKATVKNGTGLPILAGPAHVFVGGAFVGDATLSTTGPGGTLELPLGADEDIRLTRTVIPTTKTQGFVVGEREVTDYAVKIEVGNYKKRPITIRVVDQVPKTAAEKVEVLLVSTSPKPQPAPGGSDVDGDGLLSFLLDVPAGGTKTVTFTWRVTRPKDWRLSQ